jgi:hypothetical protein
MAALQEARSARLKSPLDRRYAETTAELEQFTKAMSEALDGLDAEQARLLEGLRMENHGATQVTANTTAPVRPSPHEHAQPEAGGESLAEQVAKKVIEKMPTPPSATTPCLPAAPVLVPRQLPAMVLVTLLERGPMEKRQMRRLPGVRESDRSRVANLLTPRGDLAERGLVRVDRATVALTERGRTEAVMQKERGTTSLDTGQTRDKSRPTHDGSP